MGLPPSHRVDHVPIIVLSHDTAWDFDRINSEIEAGDDDHPVTRYFSGETRAELDAVRAFMVADESPVEFRLRRLTMAQWNIVEDLAHRSDANSRMAAVKYSLESVSGIELKRAGRESGPLSDADIEAVRALCGHKGFRELGLMAIAVSRGLLDTEKKP